MTRERPVIVGVDLGERSQTGLAHGYAAAKRNGVGLIAVHVERPARLSAPLFPQRNAEHLLDTAERRLAAIDSMRRLVDQLPVGSVPVRVEFREGDIADELVVLAKRSRASLVVVASETHDLGTIATAMIRRAPCPVLVARGEAESGPIVAATDLTDPRMPAIAAAAEIACAHAAPLHAIHVVEPWIEPSVRFEEIGILVPFGVDEQVGVMADFLHREVERLGARAVLHTPVGLPVTEVARLARETRSRLVVVGTVRRAGMWRFLAGSIAEDIVRRAPCSVLVTRLHRRWRPANVETATTDGR